MNDKEKHESNVAFMLKELEESLNYDPKTEKPVKRTWKTSTDNQNSMKKLVQILEDGFNSDGSLTLNVKDAKLISNEIRSRYYGVACTWGRNGNKDQYRDLPPIKNIKIPSNEK